jgi:hypothetical protein
VSALDKWSLALLLRLIDPVIQMCLCCAALLVVFLVVVCSSRRQLLLLLPVVQQSLGNLYAMQDAAGWHSTAQHNTTRYVSLTDGYHPVCTQPYRAVRLKAGRQPRRRIAALVPTTVCLSALRGHTFRHVGYTPPAAGTCWVFERRSVQVC